MRETGIIMNGVTGRMGTNQHLIRSILAIRQQGGIVVGDGITIIPRPVLVGRNQEKLKQLAEKAGVQDWTTDLEVALSRPDTDIYFDAQTTDLRVDGVKRAIQAGKHIYCEKPTALTVADALDLYHRAESAGLKHGVVQDKLWLPGLIKLRNLVDTGFFGRILSVRGEFGYWVFEGDKAPAQRPSWNYRKDEGGGIVLDMFAHWRYILDQIIAPVRSVSACYTTHIDRRWDENGNEYKADADDAAYATFLLEGGIIAQFNSSWTTRVRRDDLLTIHIDGTLGSAVAGLRRCFIQAAGSTPRPVWNPDMENTHEFYDDWEEIPDERPFENAFKTQWELFLRHVFAHDPFPWNLLEGARGVQLAEAGYESGRRRCWVDLPHLV